MAEVAWVHSHAKSSRLDLVEDFQLSHLLTTFSFLISIVSWHGSLCFTYCDWRLGAVSSTYCSQITMWYIIKRTINFRIRFFSLYHLVDFWLAWCFLDYSNTRLLKIWNPADCVINLIRATFSKKKKVIFGSEIFYYLQFS